MVAQGSSEINPDKYSLESGGTQEHENNCVYLHGQQDTSLCWTKRQPGINYSFNLFYIQYKHLYMPKKSKSLNIIIVARVTWPKVWWSLYEGCLQQVLSWENSQTLHLLFIRKWNKVWSASEEHCIQMHTSSLTVWSPFSCSNTDFHDF